MFKQVRVITSMELFMIETLLSSAVTKNQDIIPNPQ